MDMLTPHLFPALGFGALVGLALGLLGAGGSILTVPILVYAIGMPVQAATGTSLAIVGLNSAVGALDYLRRGRSLPKTGLAFGVAGVVAAFAGAWLNHLLPGALILVLFSLLMVVAASSMLRRRAKAQGAATFDERYTTYGWLRLLGVGTVVGFLTGFFGVGGGFLIVPALVVIIGLPMQVAVGTSLLAIALNALWGLLGHLRFGTLDWGLTAVFVIGGLVGVLAGGKTAGRIPETRLRQGFAVLILLVAAYTFVRSVRTLMLG